MRRSNATLPTALPAETFVKLSREFAELAPVVEAVKSYRAAQHELDDLDEPDRRSGDRTRDALHRRSGKAGARSAPRRARAASCALTLLPKDAMDERNVILEIRAGTGGDEAALFAGDLFRMYERYAANQGWKVEIVTASEGSMGGYKEIIAEIRGRGAFAKLKYESGVHRVQRVPDTEGFRPHPHLDRDRRRAARSRGCRRRRSTKPISGSIRCDRAAPAASTSTRPNWRCA